MSDETIKNSCLHCEIAEIINRRHQENGCQTELRQILDPLVEVLVDLIVAAPAEHHQAVIHETQVKLNALYAMKNKLRQLGPTPGGHLH